MCKVSATHTLTLRAGGKPTKVWHSIFVPRRGLNYNDVVVNLLLAHSDPGNLVLVINSADYEENYFKSKLNSNLVHDSATNAKERLVHGNCATAHFYA